MVKQMKIKKYAAAWLLMPFIAIINGALREVVYKNSMGELTAHQVSTLTIIILFSTYVWLLTRKWEIESARQAFIIGFIWLGLTIAFEFIFGHFVMKHPFSVLFHDYNIFAGRVWLVFLIYILAAPYLFYKINFKN